MRKPTYLKCSWPGRFLIVVMLVLFCVPDTEIKAQIVRTISIEMSYDDNSFHNYQALSDYVTQLSIYIARDISADNSAFRLYYKGGSNLFLEYKDRFSHYHKVGIAATTIWDNSDRQLNYGANVAIRRFESDYDYSNYAEISGYGNFRFDAHSSLPVQFGYLLKHKNYRNLPEFTHLEHQLFGRLSWFLPSRTSLIIYSRFGFKDYRSQTVATMIESESGNGRGRGRNTGMSVTYSQLETPSVNQVVISLKIGQSLSSSTGLSFEYLQQINPGNSARYSATINETWNYSGEDDLFDDPYGYEGFRINTMLSQLLPWQMILRTGYDHHFKKYEYEAFDLDGLVLTENRRDRQNILWLSLQKRFVSQSLLKNFQITLDCMMTNNSSNDPYYDYDNLVFIFGSTFSF